MRCDNCRCVVPDNYEYCMYCGHLLPNGASKTIPVNQYSGNTRYYRDSYRGDDATYSFKGYDTGSGYYDYNSSRNNQAIYNDYGYSNDSGYYHYVPYNDYQNRYRNQRRNIYQCNKKQQRDEWHVNEGIYSNNREARSNKLLLWLVALDILFMLIVLMLLLLVNII